MTAASVDGMYPRVAVVQFNAALGDVAANVAAAVRHVEVLAESADLVIFPELFTTGYDMETLDHRALAEPVPGGFSVRRLRECAARTQTAITGTLIERDGEATYDTAVVIDSRGGLAGRYRKTHLHPSEQRVFSPGSELTVVPLGRDIRLGVAICFEHAFPELFAELALAGANLVAVPSAIKDGFGYLMDLRTRARAQDNQLFVSASNLAGDDGTTKWCGRSAIADPRGALRAFTPDANETQLVVDVDFSLIESERHQESLFIHRRPDLYTRLRGAEAPPGLSSQVVRPSGETSRP